MFNQIKIKSIGNFESGQKANIEDNKKSFETLPQGKRCLTLF